MSEEAVLSGVEFLRAWRHVALAGRELGSGPARVVEEYGQRAVDAFVNAGVAEDKARPIVLGVFVGLVMADDARGAAVLADAKRRRGA